MGEEDLAEKRRHRNNANARVCLGDVPCDADPPPREVHVLPAQPAELADSYTRKGQRG